MSEVYLWWIGLASGDHGLLSHVRAEAEAVYQVPMRIWHGRERPDDAFDPRRQQHSSTKILKWLVGARPPEAVKVVGITDVDLFIPILTFVYGEAQLGGHAAIVSIARLAGIGGSPDAAEAQASRLAKECIHELGHTFGLIHCQQPACVMARSVNLAQVDGKQTALCPDCWIRYHEAQQRGHDSHEQGTHPHPGRR